MSKKIIYQSDKYLVYGGWNLEIYLQRGGKLEIPPPNIQNLIREIIASKGEVTLDETWSG